MNCLLLKQKRRATPGAAPLFCSSDRVVRLLGFTLRFELLNLLALIFDFLLL
jgi:hypothetical protein